MAVSRDLWRARNSKKQDFTPRNPAHTSGTERALLWAAPPGKPVAKVLQGLTQLPEGDPRAMIFNFWDSQSLPKPPHAQVEKEKKAGLCSRGSFVHVAYRTLHVEGAVPSVGSTPRLCSSG